LNGTIKKKTYSTIKVKKKDEKKKKKNLESDSSHMA